MAGNRIRRVVVEEIKAILESSGIFRRVSTGKITPLTEENTFPSCFVKVDGTSATLNGNIGTNVGCEYDMYMDVRLVINLELQDDLDFLDVESDVVSAMLSDSGIWSVIIDREFIGSGWDSDANYPKKEGELGFSVRYRSPA